MNPNTTNESGRAKKPLNVLVVDDDRDFLLQQKMWLEAAGHRVSTAGGESEAKQLLDQSKPDLIVMDLMMENTDGGFTLCYQAKKQYPDLPIILVSSVNAETGLDLDAATMNERSWIKADAFLSKPIRFEQLKREIDRLVPAASTRSPLPLGEG